MALNSLQPRQNVFISVIREKCTMTQPWNWKGTKSKWQIIINFWEYSLIKNWHSYLTLKYIKQKCFKALQLLRVVANTDWGADHMSLVKLYRALIRSKLDYGCFIYGLTLKSYLKILATIHHAGLRLALGAFKTSPVESVYMQKPMRHL